jgi:hypothetical protein
MIKKILALFVGVCFGATVMMAGVTSSDTKKNAYLAKRLNLTEVSVVMSEAGTGTNGFGGTKIFDFKEGCVNIHGVTMDLKGSFNTNVIANGAGLDLALGTATAIATTGTVTHTGTKADLCPNVNVDPFTNGVTPFQVQLATDVIFDGTSTAKDMYLNVLIDDGDISAAATGLWSGTVSIKYSVIGDY